MELLLNLAWMLLALPAFWLWRRGSGARGERRITSLQFLLALGCALVLLFPVVSATDDLHAMRAEMEESAASRRMVRQASAEKSSPTLSRWQGATVALDGMVWWTSPQATLLRVSEFSAVPRARRFDPRPVRAPPSVSLV